MQKLKQVLAQEDTVLFLGSGLSLWSGLPSWAGLIEELAQFMESSGYNADLIRTEALKGDLLQAASYGFDKLTKQQIGEFIRAACRYGNARPHEIHRKVVSLGVRCYVTTNYDNLIEEALRRWQPNRFVRPPITNRQLTETAEIVHSRAVDFVFKPHGDAADSDSIILTREQYRQLLPQGERHHALESLKMLLASRPVVYIGFGLRDPDFLYVRDLLANTYKGGTRDHYAIIADVTDGECDYWRRNYGIHLVGYATTLRADQTKDHTKLLTLIDSLSQPIVPLAQEARLAAGESALNTVLALARHASRLLRLEKVSPELPIRVHAEQKVGRTHFYYGSGKHDRFNHQPVQQFLFDGPDRSILIGLPGSGKTYALSRAAARLAEDLHELCLSESFDESSVVVPILVDLKLYGGSLARLINQTLPTSLSIDQLTKRFQMKIFLDSFNEMPREFSENGEYEADFAKFIAEINRCSLVVGSRTSDGLDKFGFPVYCLDQIDESVIDQELAGSGVLMEGRFEQEMRSFLQKPFFFQLVAKGTVKLEGQAHPRDFYESLLKNVRADFKQRFSQEFALEKALSLAAYDAINRGEEAFPLAELLGALNNRIEAECLENIDAREVANWLVSTSLIIPHMGGRVAFVHQSITEFLAATELAVRYCSNSDVLRQKLTLTRWDQALFLALSLLPQPQADEFFRDIAHADFELALTAAKYVEQGRDEIVSKLLSLIPEKAGGSGLYAHKIGWLMESSLPVGEIHYDALRSLMGSGDTVAADAVKMLVKLKGILIKDELLQALIDSRDDYNYCCNGIADALQPLTTIDDIKTIVALADSIESEITADSDDEVAHGFTSGAAKLLSGLEFGEVRKCFLPTTGPSVVPEVRARILCNMLWGISSTSALEMAADLLIRGVKKAATSIYFIGTSSDSEIIVSWDALTLEHVNILVIMADDVNENAWGLKALQRVCFHRADLAKATRDIAVGRSGIARAALLFCASPDGASDVFKSIAEFVGMSAGERAKTPMHYLEQLDLNWEGHEVLLVQLLKLRDTKLALSILNQIELTQDSGLGELDIGPIDWFLDWLETEKDPTLSYFLRHRVSQLFAHHLSSEVLKSFLTEFNRSDSRFRPVLASSILLYQNQITTDDFNQDAISFLLSDLTRPQGFDFDGHLLGATATEKFVLDCLIPLLHNSDEPLKRNLEQVLRQAGSRHGRRYAAL